MERRERDKKKPTWALCALPNLFSEKQGHAHFTCFTAFLCTRPSHDCRSANQCFVFLSFKVFKHKHSIG